MLNYMDAESAIVAMVELALPRHSPVNRVLIMGLDVKVERPGNKVLKVKRLYRNVHLMFHRPDNYTKALWFVTETFESSDSIHMWEVKSNHDTCWKTDGVSTPLWRLIHRMTMKVDDSRPMREFEISISLSVFGRPKLRELEYDYNREERTFNVKKFGNLIGD